MKIIIIGAGPGGYETALLAAKRGVEVVLIESGPVGGTCLNEGCIPTKAFCKNAEVLDGLREAEAFGVTGLSYGFDFNAVTARKNAVVEQLRGGVEGLLGHKNITLVRGKASFKELHTVAVDNDEYTADYIIIATGSVSASLPIPGADLPGILTSKEILDIMVEGGAVGAKVDFFRSESDLFSGVELYELVADYCTDNKLMVNFHGSSKPTGLSAKYPNEVSREGIKGMENFFYNPVRYPDIAHGFTTLTFVRGLAGHGDWTPLIHDGFGLAAVVLTDSPLATISATWEDLEACPAKDLLKQIPASFDKTVVLPESEFGKYISLAKAKNGNWYVAGMNAQDHTVRQTIRPYEFMPAGIYRMDLWFDSPEGLRHEYRIMQAKDLVHIDVPAYRGYALSFQQLYMNYHGGEITGPVTLAARNADCLYYTTDGTDPATSDTRILYSGKPIKLENSCYIEAVSMKDGKEVARIRHRFNKIED